MSMKDKKYFITEAIKTHGERYDYSMIEFNSISNNVSIVCERHGIFTVRAYAHIKGSKCRKCSVEDRTFSMEHFIEKSKEIHNDKYIYDKSIYEHSKKPLVITCPIHGDFKQRASTHMGGSGCGVCANKTSSIKNMLSNEEYISRCEEIYKNKFSYTNTSYNGYRKTIKVMCHIHGECEFNANHFINGKSKCIKCKNENYINQLIEIFKKRHNDKYDYTEINYDGVNKKINIICPEHGVFIKSISNHLAGVGCNECNLKNHKKVFKYTTDEFIEKCKIAHANRTFSYDYSKTEYVRNQDKIIIICPSHGEFKQSADTHSRGFGCPKCRFSKGEDCINKILQKYKYEFTTQHSFEDCKDKKPLKFDFYIQSLNILIEYDGEQHFKEFKHFGGSDKLSITKRRDNIKNEYCKNANIHLIRIKYDIKNIEEYLLLELEKINKK